MRHASIDMSGAGRLRAFSLALCGGVSALRLRIGERCSVCGAYDPIEAVSVYSSKPNILRFNKNADMLVFLLAYSYLCPVVL